MTAAEILAARRRRLGPSLSLSYRTPLHIVRGEGAYLFDADGRAYLDCVNNVAHVGHAHPRVVEAGIAQMRAPEHEHPLPPRERRPLRRAADRAPARPSRGLLLHELRLRGERAGPPSGPGRDRPAGRRDRRRRLPRQHPAARRGQPVQVQRSRRRRAARGRPGRAAARTATAAAIAAPGPEVGPAYLAEARAVLDEAAGRRPSRRRPDRRGDPERRRPDRPARRLARRPVRRRAGGRRGPDRGRGPGRLRAGRLGRLGVRRAGGPPGHRPPSTRPAWPPEPSGSP